MPPATIAADDLATLFYTSGSSGQPKGVASTHRQIISALLSWELDDAAKRMSAGTSTTLAVGAPAALLAIPLFHVTASHSVFLSSFRPQRKIVSMYKWDPDLAAELIEREAVTVFTAPSALTGDLVSAAERSGRDLSSLRSVGGGGAPRPPGQVEKIARAFAGAEPRTGWGMTETNAIGAWISGDDYLGRPNSSGRCSAVLELRIVDADNQPVPAGRRGELCVRGTAVFSGYWNLPETTATSFIDGWFHTGDVAYLDDEGFLFIVDRLKDLIIRGGENIGCGEIEAALLSYPGVHEAAAYGLPDERLGEEVGATIYCDAAFDLKALQSHLAERLARFSMPREIVTTQTPLPRTASGKILRRALRDSHPIDKPRPSCR